MPSNKNALTRYKILDSLLRDRYHNYSMGDFTMLVNNELTDMGLGTVTRRCIEKDLHYLEVEGPFSAPIERYDADDFDKGNRTSKKCFRYKEPLYSIFRHKLSIDEQHLLGEIISIIGRFDGLPELDGLEDLRKNLEETHKESILSFTKNPLEKTSLIGDLFTKISHKQVIELSYKKFPETDSHTYICSPQLLREFNRRWYLFALVEGEERLRCFGLERIQSIKAIPSKVYQKYEGNLENYFDNIIGVTLYPDSQLEKIFFWADDSMKHYIDTKPIHKTQIRYTENEEVQLHTQYPQLENGFFFSIECFVNYELLRELGGYGEHLVVLTPDFIRNHLIERATNTIANYKALLSTK